MQNRPSFQEFKEQVLRERPEVKAEYEALAPIFELKKQMIKVRIGSNLMQEEGEVVLTNGGRYNK